MKNRRNKLGAILLGVGVASFAAAAPATAFAQSGGSATYMANLQAVPLNTPAGAAGGTLTLHLNGDQATITESVHGLGATFMGKPFPHVQHIHGGAMGTCPNASADTNHDGVISTPEAQGDYGGIETTLSKTGGTTPASGTDTSIAPSGSTFNYSRTITLDTTTMNSIRSNNAVIVVHGLNPTNAPAASLKEKSPLVPSLPLAATAPALCGKLVASQMSAVPGAAPQTGGGSTAGTQDLTLFGAGGVMLLAGSGLLVSRRRRAA